MKTTKKVTIYTTFQLRNVQTGHGPYHGFVTARAVREHSGWRSVKFMGKRYKLFGSIRTPLFIDLDNPIKGRTEA